MDQFLLDAHNITAAGPERAVAQARATARADFRNYRADWTEADRAHKPAVPTPERDDINDFFRALRRRFQTNCGEAYAKLLKARSC